MQTSVMSGDCLTKLVRLMEANPNAGIIQSSPKASGMDTLYARCQQFATRVYGPLFTAGLHFWQLALCTCAASSAKVTSQVLFFPMTSLKRHLCAVQVGAFGLLMTCLGSYEELPPNLLDELKRDRRWCQGNLMNFRLFLVKGMHPVFTVPCSLPL
ncbi:unnamed protein product [Ranitomeya imitator]|uniref:Uncharacterized protein n=1 Tax=Ranitomeya imitator TaxID=111125 RepID=A0ABN9LSD0_9NEOB|nr:unnamed protein product [Ranitomeya imitator]